MKKILAVLALVVVLGLPALTAGAQEAPKPERTVIEVFERDDCSHCRDFFAFIDDLAAERDDFVVRSYDLYTPEGKTFFDEATNALQLVKGTPIIYLKGTIIQGFDTAETTGAQITALLDANDQTASLSLREVVDAAKSGKTDQPVLPSGAICDDKTLCTVQTPAATVRIPFTDRIIDPGQYSLPVLAAILGTVDGFNPCAMWVLVMFLAALVAINCGCMPGISSGWTTSSLRSWGSLQSLRGLTFCVNFTAARLPAASQTRNSANGFRKKSKTSRASPSPYSAHSASSQSHFP
ncbi:MAG: hypothetical protein HYT31_01100 [Parcubacteria group bacterium]|nr:hypothetical protein [Parcubacteria group bacterium]